MRPRLLSAWNRSPRLPDLGCLRFRIPVGRRNIRSVYFLFAHGLFLQVQLFHRSLVLRLIWLVPAFACVRISK